MMCFSIPGSSLLHRLQVVCEGGRPCSMPGSSPLQFTQQGTLEAGGLWWLPGEGFLGPFHPPPTAPKQVFGQMPRAPVALTLALSIGDQLAVLEPQQCQCYTDVDWAVDFPNPPALVISCHGYLMALFSQFFLSYL